MITLAEASAQMMPLIERALDLDDHLAGGWEYLGRLQGRAGNHEAARAAHKRAQEIDPRNPIVLRGQNRYWRMSHEPERALAYADELLRIDPAASANYQPLQDRLLQNQISHYDKRMLRIKKLLALAESKNRFEADAAMTKAHELIARHNIEINRHEDKRQFLSIFMGSPALRHPREDYHLANLLQDYYFVSGIWVAAYVIEKGKMGRVLEISGVVQNLKIAEYVHDFIGQFIDAQWRKYNQGKRLNRYRKTDFAVGIIEGFRDKLESNVVSKKAQKDIFALIQKRDPQLEKYFKFKYPHTASVKKAASQQDTRVLNDGKKLGKKLVIAKGICELKKAGKTRLITST
jgi:tetratricopeptide (TPR) repeat protein